MQRDYYTIQTKCDNCGLAEEELISNKVEIPKGVLIVEWLRSEKCPGCGCSSLVVKN